MSLPQFLVLGAAQFSTSAKWLVLAVGDLTGICQEVGVFGEQLWGDSRERGHLEYSSAVRRVISVPRTSWVTSRPVAATYPNPRTSEQAALVCRHLVLNSLGLGWGLFS